MYQGKYIKLLILAVGTASSIANAADVRTGTSLFKQNLYNQAADELTQALPGAGSGQTMVNLTIGMNYQHSAKLHAALQHQSLIVQDEYLRNIVKAKGKLKSKYAHLYYGEVLLENGQYKQAKKFLQNASRIKGVGSSYKQLAKVNLGLAEYLTNNKSSAKKIWKSIKSNDSEVTSELAAAYARVGYQANIAQSMIEKALAEKPGSSRVLANAVNVYADIGAIEKGLKVVSMEAIDTSAADEAFGKNKEIKYFDVRLMAGMSKLYNLAAIKSLEKVEKDSKLFPVATYYLADASYLDNDLKTAGAYVDAYIASGVPSFMDKAVNLKKLIAYRKGDKKAFNVSVPGSKASSVSELIYACARAKADCDKPLKSAEKMLENLQGNSARMVSYAVGEYYLRHGKSDKAVYFLEEARDKSRKNNIQANDPVMLVSIAEAYGHNKLYSESLEIYFEMSKEFPVVRQIQDATQGIYSTEQKSAGDVKIF
ncbi:MAG: hypothetical protein OEX03_03650 [Gammaproteobacteria bacterium]|nr:hypothetical protein [Gammaproteobacteria bacterium]